MAGALVWVSPIGTCQNRAVLPSGTHGACVCLTDLQEVAPRRAVFDRPTHLHSLVAIDDPGFAPPPPRPKGRSTTGRSASKYEPHPRCPGTAYLGGGGGLPQTAATHPQGAKCVAKLAGPRGWGDQRARHTLVDGALACPTRSEALSAPPPSPCPGAVPPSVEPMAWGRFGRGSKARQAPSGTGRWAGAGKAVKTWRSSHGPNTPKDADTPGSH